MNQTSNTEPEYTTEEHHQRIVRLLADVMDDDSIVQAMKSCGKGGFYCGKIYPINRMLCPYCHRLRHRLAQSLMLLGSCQLKANTAFYEIVVTPKEAVAGDFEEIKTVFDDMLNGLDRMRMNYLAFRELTLTDKGNKSFWPHLHVIADRPILESPEPDTPKSEDLVKLKPYEKVQAFSEWQRYNDSRYDFDFKYQEPRSLAQAVDRLDYVAKPLASSWIKVENPNRFQQEFRFLTDELESIKSLTEKIRGGGVFYFPDLYTIDLDKMLNNHEIGRSVNIKDFNFKQRGQFLTVVVACWLELATNNKKGKYTPAQIAQFLHMESESDGRKLRRWKDKFSHKAIGLLVRADFVTWEEPDTLTQDEKAVIDTALDQIEENRIYNRLEKVGFKYKKTWIGDALRKYGLSSENERVVGKIVRG